ncbi:hypothetical protein HOV30_gp072 [Erwinia phage Derbicus]|uniref:Uncharacterized protein n=2 Tax=Derbicusvirus derbicus TaxID=2734104 RepID=A0A482IFH3_9CAUD|nr:hypothetical protein BIZ82_gp072 [Erwinia phage vB_EamM_EarlPhillipIV]YP_009821116.1 hypothetical protein HOV30_gp072 [Erwinia phage Derbicus]ANZ48922.1 hypothetical protein EARLPHILLIPIV_72 [Erwinia phage vB_EamM_EarlPhillipIV]QBP07498.1 hypothetical protein DERBICUS_72 [Erwinia phage Derbicus]
MLIRFSPPWEDGPDIDKGASVKKLADLQAHFFNWLYDCPQGFSSKTLPEQSPLYLFDIVMARPDCPNSYYDYVLNIVERGDKVTLSDLYGIEFPESRLRWKFKLQDDKTVVATLVSESSPSCGFEATDECTAKKMFCAELFKFMRPKTRVVDDTYSTSTQFAQNEVLTALYACHLTERVS